MSELTDLEICKRIAEIEGKLDDDLGGWSESRCKKYLVRIRGLSQEAEIYNPLKDDALCFQLMVKHRVELSPMFSGCWSATFAKVYTYWEQIDYKLSPTWLDDNPNLAICLAIIEANKDK